MELMKINKGRSDDFKKVWQLSFDDEFGEDYCTKFFELDDLWNYAYGWVDGDRLVSTYLSLEVKVLIRNKEFSAKYIDGVATIPEYRRRGLIQRLMKEDAVQCNKNSIPIMLLDPSKDSFYRKFGFEFAINKCRIRVDKAFCAMGDNCLNYFVKSDVISKNAELQAAYIELCNWFWDNSSYSELKWPKCYEEIKFLREDLNIAVAYDQDGIPAGYMIYQIEDNSMVIEHFRYSNLKAFFAMKHFILNSIKDVKDYIFNSIPEDFPLELLVEDISRPEKRLILCNWTSRMARVVDLYTLLSKVIENKPRIELCIYVDDNIIEENKGYYVISTEGRIAKIEEGSPDIITTIGDITPLLTGLKSAEELYRIGKLKLNSNSELPPSIREIPRVIKELGLLLPKITTFSADEYLAP